MKNILDIAIAVVGIISFLSGGLAWYQSRLRRAFESERALAHMDNNYKQLVASLSAIVKDQDDRFDRLDSELKELRFSLTALSASISAIKRGE